MSKTMTYTSSAAHSYITETVSLRPTAETKEALRSTMKKVEESFASEGDNPDVAELKHIVVQRIANLEASETPDASNTEKLPFLK
jgi:hypothetical protein